jgi:predicted ribosome quality control (RQC) complex YloA/Tae2 family protein
MKQKVKNQHIEYLNLNQKVEFYKRLIDTVNKSETIDEVEFYIPKKDKNQKRTKKAQRYQSFFIDGYKIMLGRDERENIFLLENSRASDFWFHLQGQVSSHVIVSNTKKTIPKYIIEESAKICAKFSTSTGGGYTVDFTQRRNVKIQNKANVLYNQYSSIKVKI